MRITTIYIYLIVICFFLLLVSCKNKSACFHSYGSETSFYIETGSFNKLNIDGDFNVNLIKSDQEIIEVIGGENNAQFIRTNNDNNELFITNDNKCNWLRNYDNEIQINVYFKNIKTIRSIGSSYIYNDIPFHVDTLFVHVNGVEDVSLELDSVNFIWVDMYVIGDLELRGSANVFHSKKVIVVMFLLGL